VDGLSGLEPQIVLRNNHRIVRQAMERITSTRKLNAVK
jgi:hypothetical protein